MSDRPYHYYKRVEYQNGQCRLIFAPTLRKHFEVAAWQEEFKKALAGKNVWPLDCDIELYAELEFYYCQLGKLLFVNASELTSESRHRFFVCTDPIELHNNWVPGLSELEQLLGYSFSEDGEENEPPTHTTGSTLLDVAAIALKTFEVPGLEDRYSLDALSRMAKYIDAKMREAEGNDESAQRNNKPAIDSEEFLTKKAAIINQLIFLGVKLPNDF